MLLVVFVHFRLKYLCIVWAILCNYKAFGGKIFQMFFFSFIFSNIVIDVLFIFKTALQQNVKMCMARYTSFHINTMQILCIPFHLVIFIVLGNILWHTLIFCLCVADFKLRQCLIYAKNIRLAWRLGSICMGFIVKAIITKNMLESLRLSVRGRGGIERCFSLTHRDCWKWFPKEPS